MDGICTLCTQFYLTLPDRPLPSYPNMRSMRRVMRSWLKLPGQDGIDQLHDATRAWFWEANTSTSSDVSSDAGSDASSNIAPPFTSANIATMSRHDYSDSSGTTTSSDASSDASSNITPPFTSANLAPMSRHDYSDSSDSSDSSGSANVKVKVELQVKATTVYDPQYYTIAELPFDEDQFQVLYSKYMDSGVVEREMESQTRRGRIRFTTVRKRVRPLIERYPNIHQRITKLELSAQETDSGSDGRSTVLLLLRQLQYFETYPPSLGRGEVAPPFDSCMAPVDLTDGDDPLEVAVMQSIPTSEALTDKEVIDVEAFILDLALTAVDEDTGRPLKRVKLEGGGEAGLATLNLPAATCSDLDEGAARTHAISKLSTCTHTIVITLP